MIRRIRKSLRSTVSRAVLYPYKIGSRSAKALANALTEKLALKVRRVRIDGGYRAKARSLLINYGSSALPAWAYTGRWLNPPAACAKAGNKLTSFRAFKDAGLSIPDFTTNREEASRWIDEGHVVVQRTMLNGHSGRGIVLASTRDQLVHCSLYVKYKKKRKEFRVHVFQNQVIDVAEKRKRRVEGQVQWEGYIRNLANGWVFCRDNVVRPVDMDQLAINSCRALGLDFGAVDIIYNEYENKCYVLEVNTAPGLEGTTLTNYTNAILGWIRRQV